MKRYQQLARLLAQYEECDKRDNLEWKKKCAMAIDEIMATSPSGAGIDSGTKLDWNDSTSQRLVFDVEFHHMNDVGYYDGWTEHQIICTADLMHGFELRVTGRNRNDIKEYLYEVYQSWLNKEYRGD